MRYWVVFSLVSFFLITACGEPGQMQPSGTLRGHVSIGPLAPVERAGEPTQPVPPEVYTSRSIVVTKTDGQTEVARTPIDPQGNYEFTLPAGDYIVDILHSGIDRASGVPQAVTIRAGEITTVDISIDTGIR